MGVRASVRGVALAVVLPVPEPGPRRARAPGGTVRAELGGYPPVAPPPPGVSGTASS